MSKELDPKSRAVMVVAAASIAIGGLGYFLKRENNYYHNLDDLPALQSFQDSAELQWSLENRSKSELAFFDPDVEKIYRDLGPEDAVQLRQVLSVLPLDPQKQEAPVLTEEVSKSISDLKSLDEKYHSKIDGWKKKRDIEDGALFWGSIGIAGLGAYVAIPVRTGKRKPDSE